MNIWCGNVWLVPDFGGQFWLIFGQAEEDFLLWLLDHCFDKKRSNQFYIRQCVQIFNLLFCFCLNSYQYKYLLTPLKIIYCAHLGICGCNFQWWPLRTVKLLITAVQNSHIWNTQQFPLLKILRLSKIYCNWNRFPTTY